MQIIPEKQRKLYLQLLENEPERKSALEQLRQEISGITDPVCLVCMCPAEDEMGCY